eukprot:gene1691-4816_t
MIRYIISTVKKYPEITPLLVVCSFASTFGIYSLTRFVTHNPETTPNHRQTNWERTQMEQGRSPDRVLQLIQDQAAAKTESA